MNNVRREYSILWNIENYFFCRHKNAEKLISPVFRLKGTSWVLVLFPRGLDEESSGCISLFLARSERNTDPKYLRLKCQLSVLAADGSYVPPFEFEHAFRRREGYGRADFLRVDDEFFRLQAQDSLVVLCRIWAGEGIRHRPIKQIIARTSIEIEKISFLVVFDGFSALKPNQKKFETFLFNNKEGYITSSIMYYYTCGSCEGNVRVCITPPIGKILSKCKIYLLNAFGGATKCGEADNRFDVPKTDIRKLTLFLTREDILNRKSEYLPNDELSVLCECVFTSGGEYKEIVRIPSVALNQISNDAQFNETLIDAEKMMMHNGADYPIALDDLEAIYYTQFLVDVKLKTKAKLFPAQKIG